MTMTATEHTNNKANPQIHQHPPLRLSKDDIQNKYDEFASKYNLEEWINNHIFGVKRLRRQLFGQAGGKVLDVAAGIGGNFPYLPQQSEITAIDLSPGMLDKARVRAKELGLKVTFQVMDAEALDFPDDTFDTVISSLSTCTFPDPIGALREMARVVKPDGQILLLEHGRSSWKLLGWHQDRTAHSHYAAAGCRWNQEPLELIQSAGLSVVKAQRHLAGVFHAIEARPIS